MRCHAHQSFFWYLRYDELMKTGMISPLTLYIHSYTFITLTNSSVSNAITTGNNIIVN